MKAWRAHRFGEPLDVLMLEEDVDRPVAGPGEILIEVACVGAGLPDLMAVQGRYPLITTPPVTPGHSLVGKVIAVCEGSRLSPGDRVVARTLFRDGTGAFAEYALAQDQDSFPAPAALSDEQAAGFVVPFHTAYVGLVSRGKLRAGETLLVLGGAGSSGSAAISLGKALGATVIATARNAAKVALCFAQGADHVIETADEHIGDAAREWTGGRGVDVLFDPVGGAPCEQAVGAMAVNGRLVLIGFSAGWPRLDPLDMIVRQYSAIGAALPNRSAEERQEAADVLDALASAGKIKVPVQAVFPFTETAKVIARLGGDVMGRLIVRVRE